MTYRERRLQKAERLRDWSAKREVKSAQAFDTARAATAGIPLGQPILVGHHSERRHRAALDKMARNMDAGIAHERTAADMARRADGIEAAADVAIYSDDPDAVERLAEKIADLEAARTRLATVNKAIRKHGLPAILPEDGPLQPPLTGHEKAELASLARHCSWHPVETKGFPPYVGSNLSGNISRLRKRLASLGGPVPATPPPVLVGETATARAGLTVLATMTTPSRPGKKPRPVWNVTGNVAFWRPLLQQLDGTWYRGAFSFWDDPTADLEAACLEAEALEREKAAAAAETEATQ